MYLAKSKEELREIFVNSLAITNKDYSYFVNWDGIDIERHRAELNILDNLVGTKNFNKDFSVLLQSHPNLPSVLPLLLALAKVDRESLIKERRTLDILSSSGKVESYTFPENMEKLSRREVEEYVGFGERIGLAHLFQNLIQKSVADYAVGVLVGLDSNGRKNRSGTAFEKICEPTIKRAAEKYGFEFFKQKPFRELDNLGLLVPPGMIQRRGDFVLVKKGKFINIEANFFNGPGSKPEEIIDSYIQRQRELKKVGASFIFITDGAECWNKKNKDQLVKGFDKLEYMMNLCMLEDGMFEECLERELRETLSIMP